MARELVAPGLGTFHKWDKIGSKLTGQYMGQGASKFGPVVIIADGGVQKKASMPGDLADWMAQVQTGEYVAITFVEAVPTKQPQPFKKFLVEIIDGPARPTVGVPTTVSSTSLSGAAETAPTSAPASGEYERLLAVLTLSNPKGAAAIKAALEGTYPEAEWVGKLKGVLTQQGVAF